MLKFHYPVKQPLKTLYFQESHQNPLKNQKKPLRFSGRLCYNQFT